MKLNFKMEIEKVIKSHFIKTSNYGVISILINLNEKWCNYAVYTRLVQSGANGRFVEALYLQILENEGNDAPPVKAEQYFHFDSSGESPLNAQMPSKNYKIFDEINKDQISIYLVPQRLLYGDDWADKFKR